MKRLVIALTDTVGIPVTKRKFAELELSLLHLQQNVEIPETHLSIHPAVRRAVEQVSNFAMLSLNVVSSTILSTFD